jgi:hypothetical protein
MRLGGAWSWVTMDGGATLVIPDRIVYLELVNISC